MKKFYLLMFLFVATLVAKPVQLTYVGQEIFSGDKYGSFKGDLVATLSDGSGWKIHCKDREKFMQWSFDEVVHIMPRPRDYWFKREHHFYLVNDTRKEEIRAMLIYYPQNLTVVTDRDIYLTDYTQCQSGTAIVATKKYQTNLYLSDGYCYKLYGKYNFDVDDIVYPVQSGHSCFLIYGSERHSNYLWTKKSKRGSAS